MHHKNQDETRPDFNDVARRLQFLLSIMRHENNAVYELKQGN